MQLFHSLQAGATGDVYGINKNNVVYRRIGITELAPMGSGWEIATQYGSHVTTGLHGQYLLVNGAIFESLEGILLANIFIIRHNIFRTGTKGRRIVAGALVIGSVYSYIRV